MIVKNLKAIEQYTFLDLIQKYTIIHAYMHIHHEGCHIGSHVPGTQTSVQEDPPMSGTTLGAETCAFKYS